MTAAARPTAPADRVPPHQALLPERRWPVVGESAPRPDPAPWTVTVTGLVARPETLALEALRALGEETRTVDIHCVTRWSKLDQAFTGVPLARLLDRAGVDPAARFVSFGARSSRGHSTSLPLDAVRALDPLVAVAHAGAPLAEAHGGPVRMVVPGRYFYKSVKWLETIELLAEDRLGYWEAESGYHNVADPWAEQRYIARNLDSRRVKKALAARSLAGLDLLGVACAGMDLAGLDATDAILRNADFTGATLSGARFDGANLSNARLAGADLAGASFRAADLEGADLRGADLAGADLTGASLFGTTLFPEPTDPPDGPGPARVDARTTLPDATADRLSEVQQAALAAARRG
jgi:DMSO/TMAO reductase YedYZ molybdopterin-dependent catalytic subunit